MLNIRAWQGYGGNENTATRDWLSTLFGRFVRAKNSRMKKEILEYLNENNGIDYRDLVNLFVAKFPNENEAHYTFIKKTIESLREKKFIETRTSTYGNLGNNVAYPLSNNENKRQPLTLKLIHEERQAGRSTWNIEAIITISGQEELDRMMLNQKIIDTNESVRKTNNRTIGILGFTALLALLTYFKDDSKGVQLQLQQLQTTLKPLEEMKQYHKEIRAFLQTMAKDSVKIHVLK
ncbi:MAG: hypothetical protein JST75_07965 [Bacteroidetes bacterium]|nr:hypothetical protein [Bacteroidota bacterium]